MERTVWSSEHPRRLQPHQMAKCEDYAKRLRQPKELMDAARRAERELRRLRFDQRRLWPHQRSLIVRQKADMVLLRTEHKGYSRPDMKVEVDQERRPVLDHRALLDSALAPPDPEHVEPIYDESSASDDDDRDEDFEAAGEGKQAKQRLTSDEAEKKRAERADARHAAATERTVYPAGRFNYCGTARGTLYRDCRMPPQARGGGFSFDIHGGLLYFDVRPTRQPGVSICPRFWMGWIVA